MVVTAKQVTRAAVRAAPAVRDLLVLEVNPASLEKQVLMVSLVQKELMAEQESGYPLHHPVQTHVKSAHQVHQVVQVWRDRKDLVATQAPLVFQESRESRTAKVLLDHQANEVNPDHRERRAHWAIQEKSSTVLLPAHLDKLEESVLAAHQDQEDTMASLVFRERTDRSDQSANVATMETMVCQALSVHQESREAPAHAITAQRVKRRLREATAMRQVIHLPPNHPTPSRRIHQHQQHRRRHQRHL